PCSPLFPYTTLFRSYVSGQPGRRTVFDNFIDKLGDYLPGCGLYKFGQGDEQELLTPAAFDRSIHSPSFYNLRYNPNDALIRQIRSEEHTSELQSRGH